MSFLITRSAEIVDLDFILKRNLKADDSSSVIGVFAPSRERAKIVTSILQRIFKRSNSCCIVLDHRGLYARLLSQVIDACQVFKLGFNASLSIFDFTGEDPYMKMFNVVEAVKVSLHVGEPSARVLQHALTALISKGVKRPSIEEVMLEIESLSQILSYKPYVSRLLRLLDLLHCGRLGSAFSGHGELEFLSHGASVLDFSYLPLEFRVLASLLTLIRLLSTRPVVVVLDEADLLMPELIRALREEYALAFERAFFTLELLDKLGASITVLSCRSPAFLSSRARLLLNLAITSIPRSKEEVNILSKLLSDNLALDELKLLPRNSALLFYDGDAKVVKLPKIDVQAKPLKVESKLKPLEVTHVTLLEKLFRGLSEAAYQVLSFLVQGGIERDSLVGYIVGVLGLDSQVARRLIGTLIAYGLISDFIGRDGRYYVKITPSGIAALNEYEFLRGEVA